MTEPDVIYQPGPVARVILNRPERRNAQSAGLLAEMEAAFERAVHDTQVRVIVLSGAGTSFSGGHDLSSPEHLQEMEQRTRGLDGFERSALINDIYIDSHLRWRNLPKPTIAMVHGYCVYGGWMIASAMDFIFASSDALLIPVYGDYFTAPWDIGARKAKEILFENSFMNAEQALQWGFINRVYAPDELEASTLKYAQRVADNDPFQLRTIKLGINQTQDLMGFSNSVQMLRPSFLGRAAAPRRKREQNGEQPAVDPELNARFRNGVQQALGYLREDHPDWLPSKSGRAGKQ
jgi:enoyl-CoA hydratase